MTKAPGMRPLADLCEAVTVGHVGKTSEYYRPEGVPFLRTQNVGNGELVLDDLKFVTQQFHDSLKKSQLKPGDVLVTRVVTDEMKCGIVPADLGQANCANVILIRPKPELDPRFLAYLITAPVTQSYLLERRVGSAQQVVNTKVLKEWPIPDLPIEGQKRIVAVLDQAFAALDRARALAGANLADAEQLVAGAMEQMFPNGHVMATGHSLGDLCEAIIDCEHKTAPTQDQGIPSIRTPNVGRGVLLLNEVNRVSEETYREWTRRAEPQAGDLILAREAPAGNVAVIPEGMRVCLGQRTVLLRPKKDLFVPAYLAHLLLRPSSQARLLAHSRGATVQHINVKDIRAFKVPSLPSLVEQGAVVQGIERLMAHEQALVDAYTRQLADLATLRQSLLQKAFAGELA